MYVWLLAIHGSIGTDIKTCVWSCKSTHKPYNF